MLSFPSSAKFSHPWRKYQQRVLDQLQDHLSDNHLHIIAPPGSGKTILGLEIVLRLNKPALILAPTIAIRNQWIQRFCELFLLTKQTPDWISSDIRKPAFMTFITYQGLHAACYNQSTDDEDEDNETIEENPERTDQNFENIIKGLKEQNVKTIVVDEAHHLRNEWWHTLTKVKEQLNPTIIGLTATPPYDVSVFEWRRYLDLNGPVDTEISVPELVIEGDLCPHQDYIYFSLPSQTESKSIYDFREKMESLFQKISTDPAIIKAIESCKFWLLPQENIDWIYANMSSYVATLIFMQSNGRYIPEEHFKIIGNKNLVLPELDYRWIEILLNFYLYEQNNFFKFNTDHQDHLEQRLKRFGAIDKRRINFTELKKDSEILKSSISKLQGIKEIVDFEYAQSGDKLRLVILSDFIRKEFFIQSPTNSLELDKIGVVPIFEKLRRDNPSKIKIGVLTGSIIIIPGSALAAFTAKANLRGVDKINAVPVPYDEKYIVINGTEQLERIVINIVTEIFEEGDIELLIGTKALLGEGWDAPAINTLILASFVGSFVLSNQMRGRAIRTLKGQPEKTGNIWHLVCMDPTSTNGGEDFDMLRRRFKSFIGVSPGAGIENGINRMDIPDQIQLAEEIEKKNKKTFKEAADRESLRKYWQNSLETGTRLVEEIKVPFHHEREYKSVKQYYFKRTLQNSLALFLAGFLFVAFNIIKGGIPNISEHTILRLLFWILPCLAILFFARLTFRALDQYNQYKNISRDILNIGKALLNSLAGTGLMETKISSLSVITSVDESGDISCHLDGGTTYDKSVFTTSLQEIILPIENPRYAIMRRTGYLDIIGQRKIHAVPEILGKNKNMAEYFKDQWIENVGSCELIFTKSPEGKEIILKSKLKSLTTELEEQIEHVNKWQ